MNHRLDLNQHPEIAESLQRCSDALKFNLVMLPLYISHQVDGPLAYITTDGIWVHERVINKDPTNLHVYLAHEVFHWVVNRYSILNKFNPMMVNYITDFKINELLYTLFGFNVRKVKYKGLLNKKWFGKSLHEIGLAIIREDWIEEKTCSAEGVPHPLIGECASLLRRRYKDHLEATQEVFHLTVEEERIFADALKIIDRSKIYFGTSPVDKYVMLKAVWYCFWHKQPFAMRPEGVLPPEHQFLFSVRWPQGMVTVGRDVDALWAAVKFIRAMDSDKAFLFDKVIRSRDNILKTKKSLSEAKGPKGRRKYRARLLRHEATYVKWDNAKPLSQLLLDDIIRLKQGMETRTRPRTMFSSMTETTDVLLPQVRINPAVKRIRLITRKPMRDILEVVDAMDEIQASMGDAFTNKQEGEEETINDILDAAAEREKNEVEKKSKQEESKTSKSEADEEVSGLKSDSEATDADSENDDSEKEDGDGESDDSADENSDSTSDDADSSGDSDDGEQASDDGKSEDGEGESGSGVAGDTGDEENTTGSMPGDSAPGGSGTGTSNNEDFTRRRVEVMDALSLKHGQITRILTFMAEAETLIKQLQKQKTQIGQEGPDATYEYGNNLANMAPEEVAFLSRANTKIAFLVKYATHQLLQRAPLESKKQPVVIMLDQSGSMFSGAMYEMAAGFCLATLKYMMKEKRGVSFTVFDSSNGREVHADIGQKVDIVSILKIITTPSQGGTNFQVAFERAQEIRDHFNWKSFTGLCVTDGGGAFYHPQKILDNMKPKDRFVGILVNRHYGDSLAVVCDEIKQVSDRSLVNLVNASKSIF